MHKFSDFADEKQLAGEKVKIAEILGINRDNEAGDDSCQNGNDYNRVLSDKGDDGLKYLIAFDLIHNQMFLMFSMRSSRILFLLQYF